MFATTPLALAVESLGLRATMIGLSVFGPAIAAAVALLARDSSADAGLAPIEDVPAGESLSLDGVLASAKRILEERETWLISAIMFCTLGINITVLGAWAVPYVAQVCNLSVTGASAFALAGSLGLLVGPPSIGWLSDLTGRRTELIIVGVFVFVCAYRILAVVRLPLLAVGIVFFVASATGGAVRCPIPLSKNATRRRPAASQRASSIAEPFSARRSFRPSRARCSIATGPAGTSRARGCTPRPGSTRFSGSPRVQG